MLLVKTIKFIVIGEVYVSEKTKARQIKKQGQTEEMAIGKVQTKKIPKIPKFPNQGNNVCSFYPLSY